MMMHKIMFWKRHYHFKWTTKSKGIERVRRNLEQRNYNYVDLTKLAQTLSRKCVFCRMKRHVIHKMSIDLIMN
jgi:hypothetical protein